MPDHAALNRATLIDTTKCIGCRSCQVSCKAWNDLPGVLITAFFFTAGIFAWERYLERSRERRLSV